MKRKQIRMTALIDIRATAQHIVENLDDAIWGCSPSLVTGKIMRADAKRALLESAHAWAKALMREIEELTDPPVDFTVDNHPEG